MSLGIAYQHAKLSDSYDSIVIGSGMGGLATASLLARHGRQRVLVLERHFTAGGFTHAFKRPGFEWDVGVHYIGEVNRPRSGVRRIFDHLTDGQLQWADMGDVYDRVRLGEHTFDYVAGVDALRDRLVATFPHERDGIDRYFKRVQSAGRMSQLYFAEKVLPQALANVLGPALRYPALRHARRTTAEVVHEAVRDPLLRGVLTAQWGDYGLPPAQSSFLAHAAVSAHYQEGAAYPVGGASRIAQTIIPSIERAGGAVVVKAEVTRVLLEGGRAVGVELKDGRQIRSSRVVSDAGAAITFGRLVPEAASQVSVDTHGVAGLGHSSAHLCLYVGLRGDARSLGLPKHNLWVHPSADHDQNFRRAIEQPDAPVPAAFLSFGSARDPEFESRHPGHSTAEVVTFAPMQWFSAWRDTRWGKRSDDYAAYKAAWTTRLLNVLHEQVPATRDAVLHAELSTPLTTQHFTGNPHGEIYGLAHTPKRFAARFLRPQTAIDGLWLTGSDVCMCGVTGALMGGVLCASAMLRSNLMSLATRRSDAAGTGAP